MLIELAKIQGTVNTSELGERMLVSPKYLRKLAGPLEKSGLIHSLQGIRGGYSLGKEPGTITIAMVFEAFSESLNLINCIDKDKGGECTLVDKCLINPVWEHVDNIIKSEFNRITVQSILDDTFLQGDLLPSQEAK
ncbi:MAG: Rrf2 family transcriptional regulator [bacterium]|nr:Rrf2 family transcriptional regulator [bacterium]